MDLHGRSESFHVEITRSHLSYASASGFIEQARRGKGNWMLFAPYVPAKIGRHLAENKLSYADAVGNCHVEVADARGLIAHVEGRKPVQAGASTAGVRVPTYQLVFALLARPRLLEAPVRDIAEAAGIGKSTVSAQLRRLEDQGLVDRKRGLIVRRRELRDRWLSVYPDAVRPAWLIGRFRPQIADPEELERRIEKTWGQQTWALGGGAAAWRMSRFYRGPDTVLHVHSMPAEALRKLRVVPDPRGALTILRTPGAIAYEGPEPHLAHPLLVYSEMMCSSEPRMREAAAQLAERFLELDQ